MTPARYIKCRWKARSPGQSCVRYLNLPGLPFWLIGAPYGKTENILEIHYRLRDKTSRVLFEKNYAAKNGRYNGYYYHPVEAEFEPLVRQISLELAEDLKNYFSENPSAL